MNSSEQFCYLTTTGRRSGHHHTIEIWFALIDATVFMLADNADSDWVRNLVKTPQASIRIGEETVAGRHRVVSLALSQTARKALLEKYQPEYSGDLAEWAETATLVAVELTGES